MNGLEIEEDEKEYLKDEISVKYLNKTLKDPFPKSEYEMQIKEQIKKWRITTDLPKNLPLEWIKVFYKFKSMTRATVR